MRSPSSSCSQDFPAAREVRISFLADEEQRRDDLAVGKIGNEVRLLHPLDFGTSLDHICLRHRHTSAPPAGRPRPAAPSPPPLIRRASTDS